MHGEPSRFYFYPIRIKIPQSIKNPQVQPHCQVTVIRPVPDEITATDIVGVMKKTVPQ